MAVTFEIRHEPPDAPAGHTLVGEYQALVGERFGASTVKPIADEARDYVPPGGAWLVVYDGEHPVGCGGVRTLAPGLGEIKRMYLRPTRRGRGLGRRLLEALEQASREIGHTTVRLDTNSKLTAAVALYRRAGYTEIPDYNGSPDPDLWFEKQL